jgi:hypothetical protein
MRMETPIIYVYPPDGKSNQQVDINVQFRGGWISEWYPNANVSAPGFEALVLNELQQRPTKSLNQFVRTYRLSFEATATDVSKIARPVRPVAGN